MKCELLTAAMWMNIRLISGCLIKTAGIFGYEAVFSCPKFGYNDRYRQLQSKEKKMAKSVYQVWLNDNKMCRHRKSYEAGKCRYRLFFLFSYSLSSFFIISLFLLGNQEDWFKITFILLVLLLIFIEKFGSIYKRFTGSIDWTRHREAKAFGDKFVKRAVKAGCDPQKAVDAMVPFLAAGDISYKAFDGYCRERQMKADKQAADEADQEQQRRNRQRYEKAAGHLQKKFLTPADGTAGQ